MLNPVTVVLHGSLLQGRLDGIQSPIYSPVTDPVQTHLAVVGASLMLTTAPGLLDRVTELDTGIEVPDRDAGSFLADLLINGIATS